MKSFLNELEKQGSTNQRVTVTTHTMIVRTIFYKEKPRKNLVNLIDYRPGGNDFRVPLRDAYEKCCNCHSDFDKLILYFMSDGTGNHPWSSINLFSDHRFRNKIEFHCVGFGDFDLRNLKRIAQGMPNGNLTHALTAAELERSMLRIIPNLYSS